MAEQRVALVTGGANGLGRADAERLAEAGYHVVVADLDGSAAESVASAIGGQGILLDVTDPAAVEQSFARSSGSTCWSRTPAPAIRSRPSG